MNAVFYSIRNKKNREVKKTNILDEAIATVKALPTLHITTVYEEVPEKPGIVAPVRQKMLDKYGMVKRGLAV